LSHHMPKNISQIIFLFQTFQLNFPFQVASHATLTAIPQLCQPNPIFTKTNGFSYNNQQQQKQAGK
jgi:hypothetical protein